MTIKLYEHKILKKDGSANFFHMKEGIEKLRQV